MSWLFEGDLAGKDAIEGVRWKHRIVAYALSSEATRSLAFSHWEDWEAAFLERDLVWANVGSGAFSLGEGLKLSESEKEYWRQRLSLGEGGFVLIGKDGGVKARQSGELDLPEFFALIDTMPMRRSEMREAERRDKR